MIGILDLKNLHVKKTLLLLSLVTFVSKAFSQLPEDVLRYSYWPQHGSARSMAIGGAMGSLGGDINALYVNPAGLGLYKTSEFVISPGFVNTMSKSTYRGTEGLQNSKSNFDLGTSGLVVSFNGAYSKLTSQAFSIGVNQTANFNNTISYKGTNNYSSYTEQFAEQISKSGMSINDILNDPRYAFGSAPALYTYLVDTFRNAQTHQLEVKGLPEFLLANNGSLVQEKTIQTKGGIYEIALGYAANTNDKFYWGIAMGIPIVSYDRYTYYKESDPSGNLHNNFDNFTLNDHVSTRGAGANFKLGVLYRPLAHWRFGVTVHTPTWYSLTDKQFSTLTANTEDYNGISSANSGLFPLYQPTGGDAQTRYTASTPWKALVSASYVFNEVSDTRKQRAFITADIEYIGYSGGRFGSDEDNATDQDNAYYDDLKSVIKSYYKGAFNYRLGGELKFNTFMVRLGGSYYSNPYKDASLKSNIMQGSAGIGYRDHGIFIDLTYVYTFNKDVDFPYRLEDKANTFATVNNTRSNVMLTFGIKL